jgi:hypothetical protein
MFFAIFWFAILNFEAASSAILDNFAFFANSKTDITVFFFSLFVENTNNKVYVGECRW